MESWLTPEAEAAAYLGVDPYCLATLRNQGRGPGFVRDGGVKYFTHELSAWKAELAVHGSTPRPAPPTYRPPPVWTPPLLPIPYEPPPVRRKAPNPPGSTRPSPERNQQIVLCAILGWRRAEMERWFGLSRARIHQLITKGAHVQIRADRLAAVAKRDERLCHAPGVYLRIEPCGPTDGDGWFRATPESEYYAR